MRLRAGPLAALAALGLGMSAVVLAYGEPVEKRDAEMVFIPGGTVMVGDDAAPPSERPAFRFTTAGFFMDRTPVTVAQFAAFAQATGYTTDAEKLGSGLVLLPGGRGWAEVRGATWRRPFGPERARASLDHPVTQVSWNDAHAFCAHYGARLPSEFEWERAARLGQTPDGRVFKAGDPISFRERYFANVWQGLFPILDEGKDGYTATSPVGAFGAAPSGLTDMAGNVWEWTASWYRPYIGRATSDRGSATERVQRGGSFLCGANSCQGFRATARGHSTPETSSIHIGFRCVADGSVPPAGAGLVKPPVHAEVQGI